MHAPAEICAVDFNSFYVTLSIAIAFQENQICIKVIMSKGIVLFSACVCTLTASCNLRTSGTMIGDGTVPPEVIEDSGSDEAIEDAAEDEPWPDAPVDAQPDPPWDTAFDLPLDAVSDEPDCPPGEIYCDGSCVDPDWNPDHCGWCTHACGGGERCCEGSCRECCNASHCDDGEPCTSDTCSGGTCSHDALADMDECGGGSGVCCFGTCRVGGNCCVNADCVDGTGSCGGTPHSCDYGDKTSCDSQHGCYWRGPSPDYCAGEPVACGEMPSLCNGCTCSWNADSLTCGGTIAVDCGWYNQPDTCDECECYYPGGRPPLTCSAPSGYGCHMFSCSTQEGCGWTGTGTGTCTEFTCM